MTQCSGSAMAVYPWVVSVSGKEMDQRSLDTSLTPKLASYCPWCPVEDHIICKLRAIAAESMFLSVTEPQLGCIWGAPKEVMDHRYAESKTNLTPKQYSCTV